MGCGASARGGTPPPATPEQASQMCQDACVRMQVVCIYAAFEKPDQIKINPPDEIQQLKAASAALKEQAGKMGDANEAAANAATSGSMVGGMMAMAKGAASAAGGAGILAMAQGLDALNNAVEAPFQTVAKDVLVAKKVELYNTCVAYINTFKFKDPVKISRGTIDGSGFAGVKGDAISSDLAELTADALYDKMVGDVTAAIKEHAVTKAWEAAQKAYTAAYEAMAKVIKEEDMAKAGIKPVRCDLNMYITIQIWLALAKLMAAEEATVRKDADSGKKDITMPKKPISFKTVFSDTALTNFHYDTWASEGK